MNSQAPSTAGQVNTYACGISGREGETWVNARSPGQAKMEFWRDLDGCFPNLPYTKLRARLVKRGATSSMQFLRNAQYRGLPQARCGDRVIVGGDRGVIVGHDSSANFEVLFDIDSPKYAGLRLSVHPSELRFDPKEEACNEQPN